MSARAALFVTALAALAACGSRGSAVRGEQIGCTRSGAGETCILEDTGSRDIVIHHPDGGFRRFRLAPDGLGLLPADGADPVRSVRSEGIVAVTVGQDRYTIPATLLESVDAQ